MYNGFDSISSLSQLVYSICSYSHDVTLRSRTLMSIARTFSVDDVLFRSNFKTSYVAPNLIFFYYLFVFVLFIQYLIRNSDFFITHI